MTKSNLKEEIERLVDAHGLQSVMIALAAVSAKATTQDDKARAVTPRPEPRGDRQERRGPTQSKWIALGALAFGAIPGALAYLIVPHWLAFVVVTLLAGGAAYQVWREMVAHVKIVDRGDWPNK